MSMDEILYIIVEDSADWSNCEQGAAVRQAQEPARPMLTKPHSLTTYAGGGIPRAVPCWRLPFRAALA